MKNILTSRFTRENLQKDLLFDSRKRYFIKIGLDYLIFLLCAPLAVFLRMGHIDAWELLFVYTSVAAVSKLVSLYAVKI